MSRTPDRIRRATNLAERDHLIRRASRARTASGP
jgi:hypothetical protein